MELDEASGEYKVAGQRTMQDFTDGLNLSMPMVQAMFGKMEEVVFTEDEFPVYTEYLERYLD